MEELGERLKSLEWRETPQEDQQIQLTSSQRLIDLIHLFSKLFSNAVFLLFIMPIYDIFQGLLLILSSDGGCPIHQVNVCLFFSHEYHNVLFVIFGLIDQTTKFQDGA